MPVNPYFAHDTSEQNLYEDLFIEAMQIHGNSFLYIPRTVVNVDVLLGEDIASKFTQSYDIEMYIENVDGYDGKDIFSKFGMEIRDEAKLVVSKSRFEAIVTAAQPTIKRPREGDLVYFPISKSLFEITFVEHEDQFYALGKVWTYKLSVSLFEQNDEVIDTGDEDELEESEFNTVTHILELNSTTNVAKNHVVSQNSGGFTITGTVQDIVGSFIYVSNVSTTGEKFRVFVPGAATVNAVSKTIVSVTPYVRPYGENDAIQETADEDVVFDPDNPFGEP